MKILIWTDNHDPLDRVIEFVTHGKGTHVAFLRKDGATVHEAFWPQVRDRALTAADKVYAEVYELEGMTDYLHDQFEKQFDCSIATHTQYSITDLFRIAFNDTNTDEKHTICSRYFMHCCCQVLPPELLPLARLEGGDWASPRDVRISPRLHALSWGQIIPKDQ